MKLCLTTLASTSAQDLVIWKKTFLLASVSQMGTRSRSRSKDHFGSVRLHIAFSDARKEEIIEGNVVRQAWFGDGRSIVLKDTADEAVRSFYESFGADAEWVLSITIAAGTYTEWSHTGVLRRAAHVYGYRLHKNLDLRSPEVQCSLHPLIHTNN